MEILHLTYDISLDVTRTRIADELLAIGFIRMQESVYIGKIENERWQKWLNKWTSLLLHTDKLDILILSEEQVLKMQQIGMKREMKACLGYEGTYIF